MEDKNKKANRKGCYKNTALGCDLKMILRSDRFMKTGKDYQGVLRRDVECEEFRYDEHFTFVETLPATAGKRNPHVYDGKYITITRRDDGSLRPNFKPIKNWANINAEEYAVGVGNELLWALESVTVPNVPINF
jgi:hypothetical protein